MVKTSQYRRCKELREPEKRWCVWQILKKRFENIEKIYQVKKRKIIKFFKSFRSICCLSLHHHQSLSTESKPLSLPCREKKMDWSRHYLPSWSGLVSALMDCCELRPCRELLWLPMKGFRAAEEEEAVRGKEIKRFI